MKSFASAIKGEGWEADEFGAVMKIDDVGGQEGLAWYEIRLEPLMFGQFYLAVYSCDSAGCVILAEKVPVRPGGGAD